MPIFVQEILDDRVVEGEKVVFECQYSGTPTPDVVWLHDDKMIKNTRNIKIRFKDNNKTSCTITKATLEDAGTYVCKATSDIGLAVTKAKLYVQGKFVVMYIVGKQGLIINLCCFRCSTDQ